MQFLLMTALSLSFGFALLQCGPNAATTPVGPDATAATPAAAAAPEDDAPRITLADAKAAFDKGDTIFVDTRGAEQYAGSHIKGAVNIPFGEMETRYKELPKDKQIIAYCS